VYSHLLFIAGKILVDLLHSFAYAGHHPVELRALHIEVVSKIETVLHQCHEFPIRTDDRSVVKEHSRRRRIGALEQLLSRRVENLLFCLELYIFPFHELKLELALHHFPPHFLKGASGHFIHERSI
jgi:hypothetical protein